MLGMPTETKEDLEMTLGMIREIKPELHSVAYFSPIPGSDLYDYCNAQDLIRIQSCEGFVRNPINEKLKGVDYKMIAAYKDKILRYRKVWWLEDYFAFYVFHRWKILFAHGYIKELLFEVLTNFPGDEVFLRPLRRLVRIYRKNK